MGETSLKGFPSFPEVTLNVSRAMATLASSEKTRLQEQTYFPSFTTLPPISCTTVANYYIQFSIGQP